MKVRHMISRRMTTRNRIILFIIGLEQYRVWESFSTCLTRFAVRWHTITRAHLCLGGKSSHPSDLHYKLFVIGAYKFLLKNHKPGDENSLFGFGRGCHAVSTLCGILEYGAFPSYNSPSNCEEICDNATDLRQADESDIDSILNRLAAMRSRHTRQPGPVHFVGLFDAVAFDESSSSRISLQGWFVRQAIATDEKQIRFIPTSIVENVRIPIGRLQMMGTMTTRALTKFGFQVHIM